MIVLKILLWIILICLALVLLTFLMVILALSIKIQVGFDYDEDGIRFRMKYGFIPFKIYPEMFTPEKMEKRKHKFEKLKRKFGPKVNKMMGKVETKVEEKKEKSEIKSELKKEEEIKVEAERIAKEEARLDAELSKAEATLNEAENAEAAGTPFEPVVSEDEISKLDSIKESFSSFDLPGTYSSIKNFLSGFSYDSIMALLSYLGRQTGHTFSKVLRRIIIKQFCVGLTIAGDDAAKTALKYGRVSAVAFPAMGKFVSGAKVRQYDLEINPDFLARKCSGEIHVIIALRPIRLITPFIGYFCKVGKKSFSFYKSYKKSKKKKEAAAKKAAKTASAPVAPAQTAPVASAPVQS